MRVSNRSNKVLQYTYSPAFEFIIEIFTTVLKLGYLPRDSGQIFLERGEKLFQRVKEVHAGLCVT